MMLRCTFQFRTRIWLGRVLDSISQYLGKMPVVSGLVGCCIGWQCAAFGEKQWLSPTLDSAGRSVRVLACLKREWRGAPKLDRHLGRQAQCRRNSDALGKNTRAPRRGPTKAPRSGSSGHRPCVILR